MLPIEPRERYGHLVDVFAISRALISDGGR